MSFFPVVTNMYEAYNKIENNIIQDLIVPITGPFVLLGGVIDILTSPIRYAIYKKSQKKYSNNHKEYFIFTKSLQDEKV